LITPQKNWSHHQFSRSHRHNFDHTIKMLITLLKICFTPSKFWSHHQFSRSHRHNFDHTIKMLITLLKIWFTPSKFWSHHLFSGSHLHNFVHTIKMLFTLLKICFTPSKFWSHLGLRRRIFVEPPSPTGPRKLFKEVTTAHVGRHCSGFPGSFLSGTLVSN